MKNDKFEILETAKKLREVLLTIEGLLINYDGIEGNKNYVKYCLEKSIRVHLDDDFLDKILDDTFYADANKSHEINVSILLHIIEKQFKLLDDIDSASDIFKPTWCHITRAVDILQKTRWMYCTIDVGNMIELNGEKYLKENRVVLTFYGT